MKSSIGLIIPTYNESENIKKVLEHHNTNFRFNEITVIDGNSNDNTVKKVRETDIDIRLIQRSPGGRGLQLAEGVRVTNSNWYLFLHADTYLPVSFRLEEILNSSHGWGWFDCNLNRDKFIFNIVGYAITYRSAILRNPTGDQAIWVHDQLLRKANGIPRQNIMEDVDLVRKLKEYDRGKRIKKSVTTSSRRWSKQGVLRTILMMWFLRLAYYFGVSQKRIQSIYYNKANNSD